MRVLLTNDDGLDAEGLHLLEELVLQVTDDVCVVAPLANQSGVGRAISLHKDIEFVRRDDRHYGVSGTPADCVMMALNLLYADNPPDLVLSGINHGMNVADDVGYSGTVGGAMEAAIVGIPAIAVSQRFHQRQMDFTPIKAYGHDVLAAALKTKLPERTVLNINFPEAHLGPVKGIRQAVLDEHKFSDEILPGDTPNSYRIGPLIMRQKVNEGSDRWWLNEGYVTFTPLHMNATHMGLLPSLPEADF